MELADIKLPEEEEFPTEYVDITPYEGVSSLASVFANPKDLERYSQAIGSGASEQEALRVGDNGVGAWGDDTTSTSDPIVALPPNMPGFAYNRKVLVKGPGGEVVARIADKAPRNGRIDLNPAAAMAVGHKGGLEPVTWKFLDEGNQIETYDTGLQNVKVPNSLAGVNRLTPIGSGEEETEVDLTEPEERPETDTPDIMAPSFNGAKPTGRNEDGSIQFSNKVRLYPDKHLEMTIHGRTFQKIPGYDWKIVPETKTNQPRIYHNPEDDKTYDLTDPSNPKEINFPSSSSGVSTAQQRKIFDKAVAEKGELRSNYPEGDEGEKAYLAAGKSKLDKSGTSEGSLSYAKERAERVVQSVDELMGQVSRETAGIGSLLSRLPETKARNFKAQLDTLKANIAFGELTEMRNASKTGGALGQVSNIELGLLESTLGALDAGQSPENLKAQLAKVKSSIQRWNEAKQNYGADSKPNKGVSVGAEGSISAVKEANETKRKAGLKWLEDNPDDPRAEEIRRRLGLLP